MYIVDVQQATYITLYVVPITTIRFLTIGPGEVTHSCWLLLASRIKGTQNFLTPRIIPLFPNSCEPLLSLRCLINVKYTHKHTLARIQKSKSLCHILLVLSNLYITIQNSTTSTTITTTI